MLETDHKLSIFITKNLDDLSAKLQRIRFCLSRYSYQIDYVPSIDQNIADVLSRILLNIAKNDDLEGEIKVHVKVIMNHFPATEERLKQIQDAQKEDFVYLKLSELSMNG